MTTPKKGDRVRVEYDATYVNAGAWPAHVVAFDEDGGGYHAGVPSFAKVTVLSPPVRVGDVATRDVLDRLPDGSVVVGSRTAAQAYTDMGERRWFFPGDTGAYGSVTVARLREPTVIFIPDPK